MITCGLKLTHDGALALMDGDRLVGCIEMEKIDNNRRHEALDRSQDVERLLAELGCAAGDVDHFVVDGWHDAGDGLAALGLTGPGGPVRLRAAPYHEGPGGSGPDHRYDFTGLPIGDAVREYSSYHHASDHLFSTYCTSPFAARGESALVLVWDGGMLPLLYEVQAQPVHVRSLGPLMPLHGNAFAEFSGQFPEYAEEFAGEQRRYGRTRPSAVAGKAMAFAGLGTVIPELFGLFDALLDEIGALRVDAAAELGRRLQRESHPLLAEQNEADLIASFQAYLGRGICEALQAAVRYLPADTASRLCLAGGCALNIKWNSMLRTCGLFSEVWVPPFPNDAGSAIGAAMALNSSLSTTPAAIWDVYLGPEIRDRPCPPGWQPLPCDAAGVARLLARRRSPVAVVDGRAELGPRALGNRSLLAPADDAATKRLLNKIKGREDYRPVAPICLSDRAADVFAPGGHDPYMLFEHRVRENWADRVPAIIHVDGTARLQTIDPDCGSISGRILQEYDRLTGIPVLCNTSGNLHGSGFFPDAAAAAEWGGTDYVWSAGVLHTAPGVTPPHEVLV